MPNEPALNELRKDIDELKAQLQWLKDEVARLWDAVNHKKQDR